MGTYRSYYQGSLGIFAIERKSKFHWDVLEQLQQAKTYEVVDYPFFFNLLSFRVKKCIMEHGLEETRRLVIAQAGIKYRVAQRSVRVREYYSGGRMITIWEDGIITPTPEWVPDERLPW